MKFYDKYLLAILLMAGSLCAQDALLTDSGDPLVNRLQISQMVDQALDQLPEGGAGQTTEVSYKSVKKAAFMSAILPGAGQFYSNSYWKAATFAAIEALAWGLQINYRGKGDDQDAEFKEFARKNWSEQRYWSSVYYQLSGLPADDRPAGLPDYGGDITHDNRGRPIIGNWGEAEMVLSQWDNTTYLRGFTHHLPETPTQQYYEMIGKYPEQFGNAWEDADFDTYYNGYENRITPLNKTYTGMRDQANDFYNTASYGAMIVLINHVVSAVDAGFTARRANERQYHLTYHRQQYPGDNVNMFGLQVGL